MYSMLVPTVYIKGREIYVMTIEVEWGVLTKTDMFAYRTYACSQYTHLDTQ